MLAIRRLYAKQSPHLTAVKIPCPNNDANAWEIRLSAISCLFTSRRTICFNIYSDFYIKIGMKSCKWNECFSLIHLCYIRNIGAGAETASNKSVLSSRISVRLQCHPLNIVKGWRWLCLKFRLGSTTIQTGISSGPCSGNSVRVCLFHSVGVTLLLPSGPSDVFVKYRQFAPLAEQRTSRVIIFIFLKFTILTMTKS